MTGRKLFEKYKVLIFVLEKISILIPKFLFRFFWNQSSISESKIALMVRYLYLKKYAANCGKNIFIGKLVTIKNEGELHLGNNISIHAYTYLDSYGGIYIKSNSSIANHCSIISFNHTYHDQNIPIKYNEVVTNPIFIEEDVWVGNGVRILPGVQIKRRSIIAAGAVLVSSNTENSIYGGVPARFIKDI